MKNKQKKNLGRRWRCSLKKHIILCTSLSLTEKITKYTIYQHVLSWESQELPLKESQNPDAESVMLLQVIALAGRSSKTYSCLYLHVPILPRGEKLKGKRIAPELGLHQWS